MNLIHYNPEFVMSVQPIKYNHFSKSAINIYSTPRRINVDCKFAKVITHSHKGILYKTLQEFKLLDSKLKNF